MNIKEYIASGILELYVLGTLSESENLEVYQAILQHPELLQEVQKIEAAYIALGESASSKDVSFFDIKSHLATQETKVVTLEPKENSWLKYTGWAAALVLGSALLWTLSQNNKLQDNLEVVQNDKQSLEQQIENAKTDLQEAKQLLTVFRDKDILSIPLAGQQVSPESYATVYWDKANNSIYLDAQGLPEPPEGKVYQVWSLTLNPLTPTSLGTIDNFTTDANKIFAIANTKASEAFGITLEPEGGSELPTLEQLYTLGTVSS